MVFTGLKLALFKNTVPEEPHTFVILFSLRLHHTILKEMFNPLVNGTTCLIESNICCLEGSPSLSETRHCGVENVT